MLTIKQIAKDLQVTTRTVYKYIREGKLKVYQFDRQYRVKEEDYQKFIEHRELF